MNLIQLQNSESSISYILYMSSLTIYKSYTITKPTHKISNVFDVSHLPAF